VVPGDGRSRTGGGSEGRLAQLWLMMNGMRQTATIRVAVMGWGGARIETGEVRIRRSPDGLPFGLASPILSVEQSHRKTLQIS